MKLLENRRIFRIVHLHHLAGAQKQAAIVGADFASLQGGWSLFGNFIKANHVPQDFQIVENPGFAMVFLLQLEIVVSLRAMFSSFCIRC